MINYHDVQLVNCSQAIEKSSYLVQTKCSISDIGAGMCQGPEF